MTDDAIVRQHEGLHSEASADHLSTTPPNCQLLPISPPKTSERCRPTNDATKRDPLRWLQSRVQLHTHKSWIEIPIDPEVYSSIDKTFLGRLYKRHDFDPRRRIFVLRMPSPVHECFSSLLGRDIQNQLDWIAEENGNHKKSVVLFADKICNIASARILWSGGDDAGFSTTSSQRQPDAQFHHKDAKYPGVVIEVSYAQDGKRMNDIAEDYILGSNGDIKVVVGVDINNKGKEAALSLWRPKYTWHADEHIDILEAEKCMNILVRLNRNVPGRTD